MLNSSRRRPPTRKRDPLATRARIFDAAERLFAERGIDRVSVRTILSEAGVNAALANYHFGGRLGLIEQILRARLEPLNAERMRLLDELESRDGGGALEDVLRALHAPMFRWVFERPVSARMLNQVMSSTDPDVRTIHRAAQRVALGRFAAAIQARLPPGLPPMQRVARFYFVLGLGPATIGAWPDLVGSARKYFGPEAVPDVGGIVEEVVAFSVAGLRAPVTSPRGSNR